MSIDTTQLKRQLTKLERFASRSTSLISLYIPGTTAQINLALENIKHELSVTSNIKSKETGKCVKSALLKLKNRIRETKFPKTGLAFFCGVDPEGKTECEVVVPPAPVRPLYKCEKFFILNQLEKMLDQGPLVGVVLFDGTSLVLGEVQDSRKTVFSNKTVHVPNKHRRGGQSANRYARQRV
jgi:peptide chain release factor subunit 1